MNIVDILIVAILAFGVLAGMHKGLIASGLSTVGFVASWLGAQSLYEKIANYALSNQTLMAVLNQYLEPEEFFTTPQQAMTTVSQVVSSFFRKRFQTIFARKPFRDWDLPPFRIT